MLPSTVPSLKPTPAPSPAPILLPSPVQTVALMPVPSPVLMLSPMPVPTGTLTPVLISGAFANRYTTAVALPTCSYLNIDSAPPAASHTAAIAINGSADALSQRRRRYQSPL
jgi:hypothetical protein